MGLNKINCVFTREHWGI